MKKFLLICAALLCTANVAAKDSDIEKLQIVQKIYANGGNHSVLMQNATQDFKSVFREDKKNTPTGDIGCIDYDVITQGQDSNQAEIKRTLKTSVQANGNVSVSFKNFGTSNKLTYVMKCDANRCLVDDILENGKSFKRSIRKCIAG